MLGVSTRLANINTPGDGKSTQMNPFQGVSWSFWH